MNNFAGCVGPAWEQGEGDEPPGLGAGGRGGGAWHGGVQVPRAASAAGDFIFGELISEIDRMLKVLHPFLVILVMMGLLQFSGQGAITFYTAQIFKVRTSKVQLSFYTSTCKL